MFHEVLLAKIESFGILSLEFVIARHPYLTSTLPKPARKAPCETTTPPFRLGGFELHGLMVWDIHWVLINTQTRKLDFGMDGGSSRESCVK